MPDLRGEKMDSYGEFQNLVVTSRLVQRCTRVFSTLVELTRGNTVITTSNALHNGAIVYTENWLLC